LCFELSPVDKAFGYPKHFEYPANL